MAALSKRLVRHRDYFQKADKEVFELSLEIMMALGARVDGQMARLTKYISSVEKALWRPDVIELSDRTQSRTVDGFEVVHQAMHSLVSHRFGAELRGRPQITLLGEGIAGGVEIYFSLQFINNGGSPDDCGSFQRYAASSYTIKRGMVRQYNSLLADPFAAFKQNAIDSVKVSNMFLKAVESNRNSRTWDAKEFERELKKISHHIFLRNKDFGNFALFVANYCGFKSTREDRKASDACMDLLLSSESCIEFMMKLGADEIIGQRKRLA